MQNVEPTLEFVVHNSAFSHDRRRWFGFGNSFGDHKAVSNHDWRHIFGNPFNDHKPTPSHVWRHSFGEPCSDDKEYREQFSKD